MNANHATAGLSVDIWNEPDGPYFWNRTQEQYLEMWGRTWHKLRTEWPHVLLTGPAYANSPSTTDTCKFYKRNTKRYLTFQGGLGFVAT